MEEKRIVGSRILDKPMHGTEDVCLGRLAHRILLVISKNDHVLSSVAKALVQISRQVPSIVDTTTQLAFLIEIIDANQQCLSFSRAARVLEVVALGSTVTERDRFRRRGSGGATVCCGKSQLVLLFCILRCDAREETYLVVRTSHFPSVRMMEGAKQSATSFFFPIYQ